MDFRTQMFMFFDKIDKGENFALVRYGDGERMLIEGEEVSEVSQARQQDKRKSKGLTKLGEALGKTLDICCVNYFYAIPCQCCNNDGKHRYIKNLKSSNYTYANIFINDNYKYFKERLKDLKRDVIVIANYEGKRNKYPFTVKKFIPIPDDCVNYFSNEGKDFVKFYKNLAKNNNDQLFFISAGPLANIIVYEMYKINPNNCYIDMGSALDERTKGRITRGFQRRGDRYAEKYCKF